MANNRLYLRDKRTGDLFLLAKSFGNGWALWNLEEPERLDRLQRWLEDHDGDASYHNCYGKPTALELLTEMPASTGTYQEKQQ